MMENFPPSVVVVEVCRVYDQIFVVHWSPYFIPTMSSQRFAVRGTKGGRMVPICV